jgi:hypothetical protein
LSHNSDELAGPPEPLPDWCSEPCQGTSDHRVGIDVVQVTRFAAPWPVPRAGLASVPTEYHDLVSGVRPGRPLPGSLPKKRPRRLRPSGLGSATVTGVRSEATMAPVTGSAVGPGTRVTRCMPADPRWGHRPAMVVAENTDGRVN